MKEREDTTALADALEALKGAIAEYGRLMVGWLDWNDPDDVKAFRAAMAPLDAHRRSSSSSSASDAAAGDAGPQGQQDGAPTAAGGGDVSPTESDPAGHHRGCRLSHAEPGVSPYPARRAGSWVGGRRRPR